MTRPSDIKKMSKVSISCPICDKIVKNKNKLTIVESFTPTSKTRSS